MTENKENYSLPSVSTPVAFLSSKMAIKEYRDSKECSPPLPSPVSSLAQVFENKLPSNLEKRMPLAVPNSDVGFRFPAPQPVSKRRKSLFQQENISFSQPLPVPTDADTADDEVQAVFKNHHSPVTIVPHAAFPEPEFSSSPILHSSPFTFEGCLIPLEQAASERVGCKCISPATLHSLLQGEFAATFDKVVVVDCRFPYEFAGGHIPSAVNLHQPEDVENYFLNGSHQKGERVAVVFHCEFSSKRGPKMLSHLRQRDREIHEQQYPMLWYENLFLLEGGYKNYFQKFQSLCVPPYYITMLEGQYTSHEKELRKSWQRSKSQTDLRKSVSRSNSCIDLR